MDGSTLSEDTVALLKRYKHGDESDKYSVHIDGHWRQAPRLDSLLRGAFSIEYERFVSPLVVHTGTQKYWTLFAADAAFGAEHDCYSTVWHGCSQANPVSDDATMDIAVRWALASALTTQAPVMTLVHVAWRTGSACTKWLGHPLVHVLLRLKGRRNPQWHATRVPADLWREDEEAYKARHKAIQAGTLMLIIANSQEAEKFLCPIRTYCLEHEVHHPGGVEYQDPHTHYFILGGMSARQYERFTPRFRLPKAFQTIKVAHTTLFSQVQQP